jgi:hypothetical protein
VTVSQFELWRMALWVQFFSRLMPTLTLRWQNQKLFSSPLARCLRALFVGLCSFGLVWVSWQFLVPWTAWSVPSFQWQAQQALAQKEAAHRVQKHTHSMAMQTSLSQLRAVNLQQQAQIDDLTLAWPNSVLRLTLLNRLQQMAHQRGLHVLQLKSIPESVQHGYESSSLKFNVRGSEWATHAFWQALNQLFQNGVWVSWAYRLLPDGQYALEGHIALLWDTQDAFTDTGVALQSQADTALPIAKVLPSLEHVLPNHSQAQMRLVGAAQSALAGRGESDWTWIRAGTEIRLIRPGQLLGKEQSMVRHFDAQGLWLSSGEGMPDVRLSWEGGRP